MAKSKAVKQPKFEIPSGGKVKSGISSSPTLDPNVYEAQVSGDASTPFQNLAKAGIQTDSDSFGEGNMAWINTKKVTGLWSINQDKNSWANIAGIGWKKLSTASSSGNVALTILMSHAREKNSNINYRDESDNQIHEVYVW